MRKIRLNNANLFRGERPEISGMGLRIKCFIQGNLFHMLKTRNRCPAVPHFGGEKSGKTTGMGLV